MLKQHTLKKEIRINGIGVHSGEQIQLVLKPAPSNTGIVFCRTDIAEQVCIPALAENVGDTTLSTALVKGSVRISTIEHLMAAFSGLGIDNAYVDVTAAEIPIMDGSAAPFVAQILAGGIAEQDAAKKFIKIKQKVEITEDDKQASLEPFDGMKIAFTIEFDHPVIRNSSQSLTIDFAKSSFAEEISRARTFGLVAEVAYLRSKNLALGASLENTIALDETKVINEGGLRYQDEFVKHKMLDALGDLYLAGHSILGFFVGHKSGHALNNKLVRKLLATEDAWEIVTIDL
jgi:UDP-3-O-[3-hydroxymyristoyl] N-acetylglucosamine deacetylase